MSEQYDPFKDPLLLEHEADGIRELDNNLPRWWVWLFNLSIAFAVCYMGYYHVFHLGDLQAAQTTSLPLPRDKTAKRVRAS